MEMRNGCQKYFNRKSMNREGGGYTDPTPAITGENLSALYSTSGRAYNCETCQVSNTKFIPFQQHMKGNKHKQCKARLQRNADIDDLQSGVEIASTNLSSGAKTCEVCSKVFTDEISYKLHMRSQNHRKSALVTTTREEKDEIIDVDVTTKEEMSDESTNGLTPFSVCNLCNLTFYGQESFKDHVWSEAHKRRSKTWNSTSETIKATECTKNTKDIKCTKDTKDIECTKITEDLKDLLLPHCNICSKDFSGPIPYKQHLMSKTHKRILTKMSQVEEVFVDEGTNKEIDKTPDSMAEAVTKSKDPLQKANLQNVKELTLPHSSASQLKEQTRQTLLKDYPEISSDLTILSAELLQCAGGVNMNAFFTWACTLCHKCFTGPEPALFHGKSRKHSNKKIYLNKNLF